MAEPGNANLVLLRHGESTWNNENRFTGWHDVPLSAKGEAEARAAGELMARAGVAPSVVHTSLLTRAIATADIALRVMGRSWIPVRRSWRLNERHYGGLTGLNKAEMAATHGDEQVHIWRRSYDVRPPAMNPDSQFNPNTDERYADLSPSDIPNTECLADVVARMLPYFHDHIAADLAAGHVVLVAAHGNSLRALVKHLDQINDADIMALNIPTGVPMCYRLDSSFAPTEQIAPADRYLTN